MKNKINHKKMNQNINKNEIKFFYYSLFYVFIIKYN